MKLTNQNRSNGGRTLLIGILFVVCFGLRPNAVVAEPLAVNLDLAAYDSSCGVMMSQNESLIEVTWPLDADRRLQMTFNVDNEAPLIHSVAMSKDGGPFETISTGLDPVISLRVGKRNLQKNGWTIFFDRMQRKPSEVFHAQIDRKRAVAASHHQRATLTIGSVSAGPFQGEIRWTFFADNGFVLQEAILQTDLRDCAYLYDAGMVCRGQEPNRLVWRDSHGDFEQMSAESAAESRSVAVKGRSIGANFDDGSIALFPPPHRYFYPLDFSDNLENIWIGPNHNGSSSPFGFGIRHDERGDNRFVPWFNAPPKTTQEMGIFIQLSNEPAEQALDEIARLTRNDRFEPIPGHTVFSSHYHVEHTREIVQAQSEPETDTDRQGQLANGRRYRIPKRLVDPGFVRTLRDHGVDIVHLAEFHFGETPGWETEQRVSNLELLHAECQRLSDDQILLLPGEEPNVHLGGHWLSLFPKPVYWVLNRGEDTPFVTEDPELGSIYHVGSAADVLRLLRAESGLAWTAHPRIKSSTGYPDRYRNQLFFQSDRFLGAAWKAMPADLSRPRLGWRVLDLLDDMSNWGDPKYVLGEVDVFKVEPDHELYGHMNVNYLRLDDVPRFNDGWQPVLDALRRGAFFVTTGEILIRDFTVDNQRSGATVAPAESGVAQVKLDLTWTFPLTRAEIVMGDGREVKRKVVDLSATPSFGERTLEIDVDVTGQRWLRAEVWDVATDGAFTQPVWIAPN